MTNNAIAIIESKKINGQIMFHQCSKEKGTLISFDLNGPKKSIHAIHIHEYGDLRNGCKSLGSHWNPTNKQHGSFLNNKTNHHHGDLINNIHFDSYGRFKFEYYDPLVHVNKIYGRSIVIHDGIDDLGLGNNKESKLTGNAGGRLACAIIARCST